MYRISSSPPGPRRSAGARRVGSGGVGVSSPMKNTSVAALPMHRRRRRAAGNARRSCPRWEPDRAAVARPWATQSKCCPSSQFLAREIGGAIQVDVRQAGRIPQPFAHDVQRDRVIPRQPQVPHVDETAEGHVRMEDRRDPTQVRRLRRITEGQTHVDLMEFDELHRTDEAGAARIPLPRSDSVYRSGGSPKASNVKTELDCRSNSSVCRSLRRRLSRAVAFTVVLLVRAVRRVDASRQFGLLRRSGGSSGVRPVVLLAHRPVIGVAAGDEGQYDHDDASQVPLPAREPRQRCPSSTSSSSPAVRIWPTSPSGRPLARGPSSGRP